MTIPDYPDYATPVAVIDQAAAIATASGTFLNGVSADLGDLSRYLSLNIAATLGVVAGGTRYALLVRWTEGGVGVGEDVITFHDAPSYAGLGNRLQWRLPVKGTGGSVTVLTGDPAGLTFNTFASTRLLPEQTLKVVPNNRGGVGAETGRLLLTSGSMVLAAGQTSAVLYVPPAARAVAVTCNQQSSAMTVDINGVHYFAGANSTALLHRTTPQAIDQSIPQYQVAGVGLEITVTNNDTVSHTTVLNVWDVS